MHQHFTNALRTAGQVLHVAEVRDIALGGTMATLPVWVQYLNQMMGEIATIGGGALVIVRFGGMVLDWWNKDEDRK